MSSFHYFNAHQQHPTSATANPVSHSHHGGRNRRQQRMPSLSQNSHKQFRQPRTAKEIADNMHVNTFRMRFETSRSFDLEDDMEFCPGLLTESDMVSIHSASSERSSLASNSPEHSPSQPTQATPAFSLNSTSPAFIPPTYQSQQSSLKLHQPAATRARNAIPIINPATGITMSSPPPSVSPGARTNQGMTRRW